MRPTYIYKQHNLSWQNNFLQPPGQKVAYALLPQIHSHMHCQVWTV